MKTWHCAALSDSQPDFSARGPDCTYSLFTHSKTHARCGFTLLHPAKTDLVERLPLAL
ncbi:hypothetical protein METHPM2_810002 [Pseudomonas sp. PM2]